MSLSPLQETFRTVYGVNAIGQESKAYHIAQLAEELGREIGDAE